MKKILVAVALMAVCVSAQAQPTDAGTRFFDNWSVGIHGIAYTPLKGHKFFKDMRAGVGISINKDITPAFGVTLEGNFYINPNWAPEAPLYRTKTVFDATNVSLLGRINFMNLFAGYKGAPRVFEIEAVGGIGWLHSLGGWTLNSSIPGNELGSSNSAVSVKTGLNLNFNLGKKKAWTFTLQPAVVWNLEGATQDANRSWGAGGRHARLNAHDAWFELEAGFTYHFKNSNGTHSFATIRPYNQDEIDALNDQINSLRNQLAQANRDLSAANATIADLQAKLAECLSRKCPECPDVKVNVNNMESAVYFRQGKSVIDAAQKPNVERVATYLKNHKDAKADIKGYASPEGSREINEKLSIARANSVKNMLVKTYKIDANRIEAGGQGVGDLFSEPSWNRVAIATIIEDKK